jgi:hypothetical protein
VDITFNAFSTFTDYYYTSATASGYSFSSCCIASCYANAIGDITAAANVAKANKQSWAT